jgi:hypothetical protein
MVVIGDDVDDDDGDDDDDDDDDDEPDVDSRWGKMIKKGQGGHTESA